MPRHLSIAGTFTATCAIASVVPAGGMNPGWSIGRHRTEEALQALRLAALHDSIPCPKVAGESVRRARDGAWT